MSSSSPLRSRDWRWPTGSAWTRACTSTSSPRISTSKPRRVVGPQVERAARHEVEACVVPVTRDEPGLDGALVQREAEMRAAVLDREGRAVVPEHDDGQGADLGEQSARRLQLGTRTGPQVLRSDRCSHASPRRFAARSIQTSYYLRYSTRPFPASSRRLGFLQPWAANEPVVGPIAAILAVFGWASRVLERVHERRRTCSSSATQSSAPLGRLDLTNAGPAPVHAGRQRRPGVRDRRDGGRDALARERRRPGHRPRRPPTRHGQPHLPQRSGRDRLSRRGRRRASRLVASSDLDVTSWTSPPPLASYTSQNVNPGYRYLRMRDGITLSMNVQLPGPASKGPYPTVIEYSGYSPADPKSPQPSTLDRAGPRVRDRRHQHARHRLLGGSVQLLRAAAVDRRVRRDRDDRRAAVGRCTTRWAWSVSRTPGSASCSSRSSARRARGDRAAVGDRRHASSGTLSPGGVLNTGFAVAWAKDRQHDAEPAPENRRATLGDRSHQGGRQHLPGQPGAAQPGARRDPGDQDPEVLDRRHRRCRSRRSTSCTRSTCRCISRATGRTSRPAASSPTCSVNFTGTKQAWFTAQNGGHADPLDPTVFARWAQFLSIFVAQKIPKPTASRSGRRGADPERGVRHDRAAPARSVRRT